MPREPWKVDVAELGRLRHEGMRVSWLAEHFEVTPRTITRHLRRMGLNHIDGRRSRKETKKAVVALHESGKDLQGVADGVSISKAYARKLLVEAGAIQARRGTRRVVVDASEAARLYHDGSSIYDLARHFGVSLGTVQKHLRRLGIDARLPPGGSRIFGREELGELKAMARGGSLLQLAEHFRCSEYKIREQLRKIGLPAPERMRGGVVDPEALKRLHQAGASIPEASRTLGFAEGSIKKHARELGLDMPTRQAVHTGMAAHVRAPGGAKLEEWLAPCEDTRKDLLLRAQEHFGWSPGIAAEELKLASRRIGLEPCPSVCGGYRKAGEGCRECTPARLKARGLMSKAKGRARDLGLPYSLTEASILPRVEAMECEYSGLPLELGGGRRLAPSLHKVEHALGYTDDNTKVVCWAMNVAINNHGENFFAIMARGFLERWDER